MLYVNYCLCYILGMLWEPSDEVTFEQNPKDSFVAEKRIKRLEAYKSFRQAMFWFGGKK